MNDWLDKRRIEKMHECIFWRYGNLNKTIHSNEIEKLKIHTNFELKSMA